MMYKIKEIWKKKEIFVKISKKNEKIMQKLNNK